MHQKTKIPRREIGEDEDELLSQLWNQLETLPDREIEAENDDFLDLQSRISKKIHLKQHIRLLLVAGIAAACMFGIWLFNHVSAPVNSSPVLTQLKEMGVQVASDQVLLKMDDEVLMSLDSAASIENKAAEGLTLHTSAGKQVALSEERILRLEVPAGRRFHMILSDGTLVWLNASSVLEYPASFAGKKERRVKLIGEAYFEVFRNEKNPFYVELGEQESICVLGTSFNVNAYPESSHHVTTLVEGKISYQSDEQAEHVILTPDQQLCYDKLQGTTSLHRVDASSYAAWKDGMICFEDEKLPELAIRLSRMYGIEIQVDERLKSLSFSGKISYERGIDYITRLMTETAGVVCEVNEGIIYLK